MWYIWFYFKNLLPKIWFVATFGIFSSLGWKNNLIDWVRYVFHILDFFVIVLAFGKINTCWHFKADSMFYGVKLYELAFDDNPYWFECLLYATYQTFFYPEVY